MTLDVKKYLQQINETEWKLGLSSKYALSGNYFFKRLTEKAPSKVHDFLLNTKLNSTTNSYVTRFVDYCNLSDSDCQYLKYKGENAKYSHVYVFDKVNFAKLDDYFGSKNIKEYMRVLDDLHHFFDAVNIAGITYHDVCWDNIVWNKTTNKLCVIDLDSMVESTNTYDLLQKLGNPLFHTSFLKFRDKYSTTPFPLLDITYLNLCIFHNIFFAFILGFSQNDKKFNLMEEKSSVNTFVAKYIEGNYTDTLENGQIIDKEFVKVLVSATQIVSFHIEGKYNGNPYKEMVLLANGLVNKIPTKPAISKPVLSKPVLPVAKFTSNITSGNAPLYVQFIDSSLNATRWRWDFGDGDKSTVQNPVHTFAVAGNYAVKLTVSNANGTDSTFETINVSTAPPKTIGQIITLVLKQISPKIYKYSPKKMLKYGLILCLLIPILSMGLSVWDNEDPENTEYTLPTSSVPKDKNSFTQDTDNSKIIEKIPTENTDEIPTEIAGVELPTYTNSLGMEFVLIPAGEFMMGAPSGEEDISGNKGPVHKITIEEPFYLGIFEVTQEQWRKVMGNNPSYFEGDELPVEKITWNDVQQFIDVLNEMEGTDKYRLPSEAEWEYACRAGTTTRYSFGDDESKLGDYAWYGEDWNSGSTHPVGQKKPNAWGLYDMHGNVCEWCQDRWHENYNGAPSDGSAWEDGGFYTRVIRGSSMYSLAGACQSDARSASPPDYTITNCGFRLLMTL